MVSPQRLAALLGAAALTLQPVAAQAQSSCVTETEVSALTIYSVPSLLQAVRLRCGTELSTSGYLARRGDALASRYTALQGRVWPNAKSGLLKIVASKGAGERQNLDTLANLPDNAVRPLIDALIVQEIQPKIAVNQCGRIERAIEVAAPIDPEMAGGLLGAIVGLANPDEIPICPFRRS